RKSSFGLESRAQTEALVHVTAPNLPTALTKRVRVHDGRMDARHLHRLAHCPCGYRRSRPASVYLSQQLCRPRERSMPSKLTPAAVAQPQSAQNAQAKIEGRWA